ncbi:hypothetical protein ACJVC5_01965 [Peredibacter sp. HCB2-198]|uniref:hypothetical protein n=1 Tax=Peredibacter sp. HCB2-198 TaxID=3383025 RepID=UPI0038B51BFF
MKFLALVLFFISQVTFATDCTPTNLITESNSPFRKIPVYDQDGTNICYAYVTSQLLDYNLMKKGVQERTAHPLWLAMNHGKHAIKTVPNERNRTMIGSGNVKRTIESLGTYPICSYSTVESSLAQMAKAAKTKDSEVVQFIETYTQRLAAHDESRALAALEGRESNLDDIDIITLIKETKADADMRWCSSNATWDALLPLLRNLNAVTTPEMVEKLLFQACQNKQFNLQAPKATIKIFGETDGVVTGKIANVMDSIKAPVSVSYCAKALTQPNLQGITYRNPNGAKLQYAQGCEHHESLIVGKKQVGNSCQLLLRNTWGSNFGTWTKDKKCLCKNRQTGAYLDDCNSTAHNNGQYTVEGCWIDEDVINRNTYQMTYLDPK